MMEGRHDCFKLLFEKEVNGFHLVTSGAFFAFIRHPFSGSPAWDISRRLIVETGLITLPGEIFGPGLSDYLRVAFGNMREHDLEDAVNRFNYINR
jgi:aspartate/methionine/tyrosine aminotransferase